jgi:hypothetical protein
LRGVGEWRSLLGKLKPNKTMSLTKEDLRAIGTLIEEKLNVFDQEKILPIRTDIQFMKADIAVLKKDVSDMKSDIAGLTGEIVSIKHEIGGLKRDVYFLQNPGSEIPMRLH